jgi:hypothetical protein
MKNYITILIILLSLNSSAQSFNDDKTAMVNYVKRLYNSSSFEGAKTIEGDDAKYYVVAITLNNLQPDSTEQNNRIALTKAQVAAQITFAEPCVKFEMISLMENRSDHKTTFLFLCETLSEFVKNTYNKKPFDGSKIVAAPNNKYFIAVITLDNSKYAAVSSRDKVAQMKAKQQANTMFNGSTISSESILRTDETDKSTEVTLTEIIREQSMGFVNGIEFLTSFESLGNKTTYIYYKTITK